MTLSPPRAIDDGGHNGDCILQREPKVGSVQAVSVIAWGTAGTGVADVPSFSGEVTDTQNCTEGAHAQTNIQARSRRVHQIRAR